MARTEGFPGAAQRQQSRACALRSSSETSLSSAPASSIAIRRSSAADARSSATRTLRSAAFARPSRSARRFSRSSVAALCFMSISLSIFFIRSIWIRI